MMAEEGRQAPWLIGAMVLGAAMASRNRDMGRAVISGGQAIAARNQLGFSRDMEREADRVGLGVLTEAGYDPGGAVAVFERLEQASRLSDDGAFAYLRTHPLTVERIADMRARLPLQAQTAPRADLLHALMAIRARALSTAGAVDGLRSVLREAETLSADAPVTRQAPAWYGAALAAQRLRDPALAARWMARLQALPIADESVRRAVRLLEGELALAAADPTRALIAAGMRPATRPEVLLAAEAGLALATPEALSTAAGRLQTWVVDTPTDASAWQLLARVYTAAGQTVRALRAEAEARVATLDYAAAVDRLRAAQDQARRGSGDHIEASIVDARLRQVQLLLREQAAER
jgi:predicted Zn-dependent protease